MIPSNCFVRANATVRFEPLSVAGREIWPKRYGLLCFCAQWHDPLLWSHYANRHRDICLGFDVRNDLLEEVRYVRTRTALRLPLTEESTKRLLFTKFSGWSYEEEWRVWARLEEPDPTSGLYFREFGDDLRLSDLIVGPLCTSSNSAILNSVKSYPKLRIIKARLAFKSFSVVQGKRGF